MQGIIRKYLYKLGFLLKPLENVIKMYRKRN